MTSTTESLQSALAALYTSDHEAFDSHFDSAFLSNAKIITNSEPTTVPEFKEDIVQRGSAAVNVQIKWNETHVEESDPNSITGSLELIRSLRIRIRVGPAQTTTTIKFTAVMHDGKVAEFSQTVEEHGMAPVRFRG